MAFQKKDIALDFIRIVVFTIAMIVMAAVSVFLLTMEIGFIPVLCALLSLLGIGFVISAWKGWFTLISQYRYAKETDVLNMLVGVNKYVTDDEMRRAFEEQKGNCLYRDDRLIVTEEFLADEESGVLFFSMVFWMRKPRCIGRM